MLGPKARIIGRSAFGATTQCFRQQEAHRAFRRSLQDAMRQRRHASTQYSRRYPPGTSFWTKTKDLWRHNPLSVTAAFAFIALGASSLVYANFLYQSYIIDSFHNFPEPVAKPLRKALYFTNIDLQPKEALKYYKVAIGVVQEIGMDPFSDEVIGIYIQLAAMFEKIEQYKKSTEVLERLQTDCLRWMEQLSQKEGNEGKRTKVLGKIAQISVKLGDLYSNDYVREPEMAEKHLVYAVETILKEQRRRQVEGVKPEEGEWMSTDEIGASFEALGHHYEKKNQFHLSGPLFLQALNVSPTISCHTAILMNNLSISIAQQNPPTQPGTPAPSRSSLIDNAKSWATRALDVTARIQPPERTEECDVGCATATHNLGEFAEMEGNIREARQKYEEAKSLAKAVGFQEGVEQSSAALARLSSARVA